jgi:chemotaxis protein methyltransferase CheR
MNPNIIQLVKKLESLNGTNISKYDVSFLNKSIQNRIEETASLSFEAYFNYLEQNKGEVAIFLNSLHNSYSQFFRNTFTFSVLENLILPNLIQKKQGFKNKEIRIWSSACASGQEAYSLAILLEELKNANSEKFNYRIIATDLHESQIKSAKKGQYTKETLGNLRLKHLKKWFTKNGDLYTVKPALKKYISFSEFDLFNEKLNSPDTSIFGDFDLIVCANILFYYNNKNRKKILEKVINNMSKGGCVVTGEAERELFKNYNFQEMFPTSAIYSKNTI